MGVEAINTGGIAGKGGGGKYFPALHPQQTIHSSSALLLLTNSFKRDPQPQVNQHCCTPHSAVLVALATVPGRKNCWKIGAKTEVARCLSYSEHAPALLSPPLTGGVDEGDVPQYGSIHHGALELSQEVVTELSSSTASPHREGMKGGSSCHVRPAVWA